MEVEIELIGKVNIYLAIILKVFTAVLSGGLIGFEREIKMKSAGVKTNMLICLGSTLYTVISMLNLHDHTIVADPNRTAAQIVSGIGFLGAGAIIQGRGQIEGMTTAATIWLVAAVGVAIGSGYPITAFMFVICTLFILRVLDPLYGMFRLKKSFYVDVISYGSIKDRILGVLEAQKQDLLFTKEEVIDVRTGITLFHVQLSTDPKNLSSFLKEVKGIAQVKRVTHQVLRDELNFADEEHDDH